MVSFIPRKWKEKSIEERLETLANIQSSILNDLQKVRIEQENKRRKILGLPENEREKIKEYSFDLPDNLNLNEQDEEKVKKILEEIGKQRYSGKQEEYKIFDTDYEMRQFDGRWLWLELRWPAHFAGYVDSINFSRNSAYMNTPAKVDIRFIRGISEFANPIRKQFLDQEAQKIYEKIKSSCE